MVLILVMSALGLSYLPYPNHKSGLSRRTWIIVFAIPPTVMALHVFGQTFNSWTLVATVYVLAPWILLTGAQRRALRESLTVASA